MKFESYYSFSNLTLEALVCSFQAFWSAVDDGARRRLAREKTDVILKAVVKRFFNEKEVTSTLVMDALYSGCKALDYLSRNKKGKINGVEMEEAVNPIVWVDKDTFVLAGDVLALLERAATESLPPYKDDKGPQNRTKVIFCSLLFFSLEYVQWANVLAQLWGSGPVVT